jgi:hypothetical protein
MLREFELAFGFAQSERNSRDSSFRMRQVKLDKTGKRQFALSPGTASCACHDAQEASEIAQSASYDAQSL